MPLAKLSQGQVTAIQNTTGPWWKKAIWWIVGIAGVIGAILVIVCLIKRKGPITSIEEVVKNTKQRVHAIDAEAKAKTAAAMGVENTTVKEVKRIAMIDDEYEQAKRMAELATEDY